MADQFIPVGGDPKFRLQYVDVSGGTADKFTPAMTPVDASGNKQVFTAGGAGTFAISQITPGTTNLVEARTQARRNGGVLHRSAIAAVDKLAVPSAPAVADVTSGGGLAQGTAYNAAVAAANSFGPTTPSSNGTVSTAGSGGSVHAVQLTIAQVAGATAYDLFMSTASSPLWVGRITETQRAAGCTVTAVGTVTGTSPGAGLVNINVVGTGIGTNVAPFTLNNAFVLAGITPVVCTGYNQANIFAEVAVTDLRSAPSLQLVVFIQNQVSGNYCEAVTTGLSLLLQGRPLLQQTQQGINGATNLIVAIETLSGQGPTVSVWVELS